MRTRGIAIILVIFTGVNVFLALNYHSHSERYSYHGELWADRGGYFMYLPFVFAYGLDAERIPEGLDSLTGHGFQLDNQNGRVITKYTSGVAILQAPFYLLAHGFARLAGIEREPYDSLDHVVVVVAGSVLLSLGLFLLFLLLRDKFGEQASAWTLLGMYTGSNLFYYTIGDPGMSHVYSFFLFALLLYLFDRWSQSPDHTRLLVLIGICAGLIVLIRPTNAVFLLVAPFVGVDGWRAGWQKVRDNFTAIRMLLVLVPTLLVWVPQLIYWQYAFGSAFTWPYVGEGFPNWTSPEFTRFWFAPNNGLFPYTPLYALVIWACWAMWRKGNKGTAAASLLAFLIVSYLGASWWVWHFGCGFGSRTMVEYLALFAFPLAGWTRWSIQRWGRWLPIAVFVLLAVYNLKLVYSYGSCWFHDEWDWQAFGQLVFGPTK